VHSVSAVGGSSVHAAAPASTTVMSATAPKMEPQPVVELLSFADMIALFEEKREALLASHLINDLRLVKFEQGRIEMKPIAHIGADVPARINRRLREWTGTAWNLLYNESAQGEPTVRELRQAAAAKQREYAVAHPKVQAALEVFPEATVLGFTPKK
jgi:DNA polymerase-3 subunit gamma/tau